jgi:hypothetical protein
MAGLFEELESEYYGKKTGKVKRSSFEAVNDTVVNFSNAIIGSGKAISDFVSPGNDVSKYLGNLQEEGNKTKSKQQQLADAELGVALESSDFSTGAKGALKYVAQNPMQATAQIAGNIVPFMLGTGAVGGVAKAAGYSDKAVTSARVGTSMALGGALGGGDAAGTAYEQTYESLKKQGYSDQDADSKATTAARQASIVPTAIGVVSGRYGAEGALARGQTKSILKTTGQEFLSEAVEEGGGQFSANAASRYNGAEDIDLMKGVAGSAVLGGTMGAMSGAGVGFATRKSNNILSSANESNGTTQTNTSDGLNSAIDGATVNPVVSTMKVNVGGKEGVKTTRRDGTVEIDGVVVSREPKTPEEFAALQKHIDEKLSFGVQVNQNGQQAIDQNIAAAQTAQQQALQQAQQQRAAQLAQQQQQAAQQAQQAAMQKQQERLSALQDTGVITGNNLSEGNFFGQLVFSPDALKGIADNLSPILAQMPPMQRGLIKAVVEANSSTGGKIIPKFTFKASSVEKSVDSGLEAMAKTLLDLDISHVGSIPEAAEILNRKSGTKTGTELEKINAVHFALTGKNTIGYEQSQQKTKIGGKTNGQQLQATPGVGEVSKQGSTNEGVGTVNGAKQSQVVQPVSNGSVGTGQTSKQTDTTGNVGVRNGTSNRASKITVFDGDFTNQEEVTPPLVTKAAQPVKSSDGWNQLRLGIKYDAVSPEAQKTWDDAVANGTADRKTAVKILNDYRSEKKKVKDAERKQATKQRDTKPKAAKGVDGAGKTSGAKGDERSSTVSSGDTKKSEKVVPKKSDRKKTNRELGKEKSGEVKTLTPEEIDEYEKQNQPKKLTEAEKDIEKENIANAAMSIVVPKPKGMKDTTYPTYKKFILSYLGGIGLNSIEDVRERFKDDNGNHTISVNQVKKWNALAKTFLEDNKEQLANAVEKVASEKEMTLDEVEALTRTAQDKYGINENTVDDRDYNVDEEGNVKEKAVSTNDDENPSTFDDADLAEKNGENPGFSIIDPTSGRYQKSIQEENNAVENLQSRWLKTAEVKELISETIPDIKQKIESGEEEFYDESTDTTEPISDTLKRLEKQLNKLVNVLNKGLKNKDLIIPANATAEQVQDILDKLTEKGTDLYKRNQNYQAGIRGETEEDLSIAEDAGDEAEATEELKKPVKAEPKKEAKIEVAAVAPKQKRVSYDVVAKAIREAYRDGDISDEQNYTLGLLLGSRGMANAEVLEALERAKAIHANKKDTKQLKDSSRTIDGEARVITEGEQKQINLITDQSDKLTDGQVKRLEKHYGERQGTDEFAAKLKEDVITYVTKGIESVSAAIRDIVKQMANGVMAMAIIFNPNPNALDKVDFNFAQTYKETIEVTMEAPSKAKMSPEASRAYEVTAPAFVKENKPFFIADKPNGLIHLFGAEGEFIATTPALYGKQSGDVLTEESRKKSPDQMTDFDKVTPAGEFTVAVSKNADYAGGYILALKQGDEFMGGVAIHSVYLGDPKERRNEKLKSANLADKKVSYGCLNTSEEFWAKTIMPNIMSYDNAGLVIVPDNKATLDSYLTKTTETKETTTNSNSASKVANNSQVGREENVNTLGGLGAAGIFLNRKKKTTVDNTGLQDFKDNVPAMKRVSMLFDSLGVGSALNSISHWYTFDNSANSNVADELKDADGTYELVNGQHVISLSDEAAARNDYETQLTIGHEVGHAVDLITHGGVYSGQPEMQMRDGKNPESWGEVAKELHGLWQSDEVWTDALGYPFDADHDGMHFVEKQGELFAQVFTLYLHPKMREFMKKTAPQTYKFMMEVFQDVRETESISGTQKETARARGENFAGRNGISNAQRNISGSGQNVQGGQTVFRNKRKKENVNTYDSIGESIDNLRKNQKVNISRLPPVLRGPVQAITSVLFNTKETVLGVMITQDVADLASKYMPSVKDYVEADWKRGEITREYEQKAQEIKTNFEVLKQAEKNSINDIIATSTTKNLWAFDSEYKNIKGETVKLPANAELNAKFKKLTPEAQQVIRDVFAWGKQTLQDKKDAIRKIIDDHYADQMAKAAADPEALKTIQQAKDEMTGQFRTVLNIADNKPYAPLKRFGSFVVVAKSNELIEAEKNKDSKLVRELQSDENHYFVEFAESAGEGERIADRLKLHTNKDTGEATFSNVDGPFKKSQAHAQMYSGLDLYKGFAKLKTILAAQKGTYGENGETTEEGERVRNRLEALVNELYLVSLADSNARKAELERKTIAGFDRDMMRAFFTQAMADAHYIANLKTNDDTMQAIVNMQKDIKEKNNRKEASPYLNEIMARQAQALEVREPSILDAGARLTADYYLATSPSFYMQQATQTYMLSVPWLAGRYKYFPTIRAVTAAYKEMLPLINKFAVSKQVNFSSASPEIAELLKTLVGRGVIDIGVESELQGHRSEASNPVSAAYNKTTNMLRSSINRLEVINRATAAVAAYRLEMAKSGIKDKATEAAFRVISNKHGLYGRSETPRLFNKNGLTRSVTQFRRFQIIQLTMLAKLMHESLKGASQIERSIARKQFGFLMAHTFVMGGVKGVPIYGIGAVAYALSKWAFGEEDDPEDFEEWLRSQGGLLLARGIPAELGIDLSGKLGLGNIMSILPYADIDFSSKSGYEKTLVALSGPFIGGLLPQFVDGVSYMGQGDYYKGLEKFMPKGLNDAMAGVRFTTEGMSTRNGQVTLGADELVFTDGILKALGIPPTIMTERNYIQNVVRTNDEFYKGKEADIKRDYVRANKEGDTTSMAAAPRPLRKDRIWYL